MSGLQFQELLQSEPPWYFRARRYDNKRGWSNGWNIEPEASVARDEPILHRLTAFADALKTLDAQAPQAQNDNGTCNQAENAWAPKKPNTLWDVLLTPGLEFMSDAVTTDAPYAQSIPPTTANNPRKIRQVNREDTPRPSLEPKSKGKEPEFTQHRDSSHYTSAEGSCSKPSTSTRQDFTEQTLRRELHVTRGSRLPSVWPDKGSNSGEVVHSLRELNTAVGNSGSSHSPRSIRRENPEPGPSTRSPKRQRSNLTQVANSSSTTPQLGASRPSSQLLQIPHGAESSDIYLDDDTFAELLAGGFFSAS